MVHLCRTPHGVRGLKYLESAHAVFESQGRTPHGVRGLKCKVGNEVAYLVKVAPLMGCVD